MADETMKQGLGGSSYDPSKVFDPSKLKAKADEAPAIAGGLDVSPNAGVSTTAGANYYAGRSMPSGNMPAIAGGATSAPQQPALAQPIGTIAGMPAASSTTQPAGPLGMPDKAPDIAGVNAFSFNSNQPAGGVVANGSGNDFSAGSPRAIAGTAVDGRGRSYDEQVAHAKEVNAANERYNALNPSPRERAAMESMNNRNLGSFTRSGAAAEVEGFKARRDAFLQKDANQQAQTIAGVAADAHKYTADQGLAGNRVTADGNVKAHEVTALGNVEKAQIAGVEKAQQQQQQQYTDRVKGLVSAWEKLNVPTDVAPKLNYFARIHAEAENPDGKVFLMPPNRQGGQYAALPRAYEQHYQGLMKSGLSRNDAVARIYGVAKKNGHAVDVPDFARFQTRKEATEG